MKYSNEGKINLSFLCLVAIVPTARLCEIALVVSACKQDTVAEAGSNSFINCFKGESGCKFEGDGDGQLCDATATRDRPASPPPEDSRTDALG